MPDRVAVGAGIFMSSAPSFVMAIVLVYLFVVRWPLFPLQGLGNGLPDEAYHLILPAVVMAIGPLAFIIKITRASMLEQLSADYIGFARARGVSGRRIRTTYVLRNSLIPVLTASGLIIATALMARFFVEYVFAIPGLGDLLVTAVNNVDIPVIQGLVLVVGIWVVVTNIIVDSAMWSSTPV